MTELTDTSRFLLGVPTATGYWIAGSVVVVFGGLAGGLYWYFDKHLVDFGMKVADSFIQGSIVAILFGILKGIIDNAKASGLRDAPATVAASGAAGEANS